MNYQTSENTNIISPTMGSMDKLSLAKMGGKVINGGVNLGLDILEVTGGATLALIDTTTNKPTRSLVGLTMLTTPMVGSIYHSMTEPDKTFTANIDIKKLNLETEDRFVVTAIPEKVSEVYFSKVKILPVSTANDIKKAVMLTYNDYKPKQNTVGCTELPTGKSICAKDVILSSLANPTNLLRKYSAYADYIRSVEDEYEEIPDHSLVVSTLVESQLGRLNIVNKYGYCGPTQMGKWEWKTYGAKYHWNCKNKKASIRAAADLAIDYMRQAGLEFDPGNPMQSYFLHNQGPTGFRIMTMLRNGITEGISDKHKILIPHNLCNNIPTKFRKGLCVKAVKYRKGKNRKTWVPSARYDITDVAKVWYLVWSHELSRIHSHVKNHFETTGGSRA